MFSRLTCAAAANIIQLAIKIATDGQERLQQALVCCIDDEIPILLKCMCSESAINTVKPSKNLQKFAGGERFSSLNGYVAAWHMRTIQYRSVYMAVED